MYYPLSQITTNLYTNGEEYIILETNQYYKGYYWKNSKGQFFTGKTPQDSPARELIKSTSNIDNISIEESRNYARYATNIETSTYNNLQNISQNVLLVPTYSLTLPTQNNYQLGLFTRYFCKKTSEIVYLEINLNIYNDLIQKSPRILWQLYQPFSINWQLTGDRSQVYKTNKNIVELTMKQQKLPQFDKYLKEDYTKYYI